MHSLRSAQHGPQPGFQLGHFKGLEHIVIRAAVKTSQAAFQRIACSQQNAGNAFADFLTLLKHLHAIDIRQAKI